MNQEHRVAFLTTAQPMVYTVKGIAARRMAQSVFDMEAA